jgi:hypothetical protein
MHLTSVEENTLHIWEYVYSHYASAHARAGEKESESGSTRTSKRPIFFAPFLQAAIFITKQHLSEKERMVL